MVMADLNLAGEAIALELNAKYGAGTAVFVKTDVSKRDEVERLFETALKNWGRVDIVANNAGVVRFLSCEDSGPFRRIVDVSRSFRARPQISMRTRPAKAGRLSCRSIWPL
jgi:NAD(P)-dependent dehydrogenase (short-subunit alcohol dehydrogenase family)